MKKPVVKNTTAHGQCVIPCDNIKQYAKVTKRLIADGIEFNETQLDNVTYNAMLPLKPNTYQIEFRLVTVDCIVITY